MKHDAEYWFQQLINAANEDLSIRTELEQTGELFEGYHSRMRICHENNAALLTKVLEEVGWPEPDQKQAYDAAWLIAIHAISRPNLQRKVLKKLEDDLRHGEPVESEYAKLYDRIALYEGRQQRYGTQLFASSSGWQVRDLEAPETVDVRRRAMKLSSLAQALHEASHQPGGFMDEASLAEHEKKFNEFLKEAGWRS